MSPRLRLALRLAEAAAPLILRGYRNPRLGVERKKDGSPVTAADRGAEALLRRAIAKAYPQDAVLGEEHGERPGSSGWRWVLDPIDGTQSFIRGVPLFGTLIGLLRDGRPRAGVVAFPALGETCWAEKGAGAFWKRAGSPARRARVSTVSRPAKALLCSTGPSPLLDAWPGLVRGWSDCYGHMLVATGRADVMVDPVMNLWDCAALEPIVSEAGGRFFDLSGRPRIDGGSAVSTNARLAAPVKRLLTRINIPRP